MSSWAVASFLRRRPIQYSSSVTVSNGVLGLTVVQAGLADPGGGVGRWLAQGAAAVRSILPFCRRRSVPSLKAPTVGQADGSAASLEYTPSIAGCAARAGGVLDSGRKKRKRS